MGNKNNEIALDSKRNPKRFWKFVNTVKLLIKARSQIEAGSLIQAGGLSRLF